MSFIFPPMVSSELCCLVFNPFSPIAAKIFYRSWERSWTPYNMMLRRVVSSCILRLLVAIYIDGRRSWRVMLQRGNEFHGCGWYGIAVWRMWWDLIPAAGGFLQAPASSCSHFSWDRWKRLWCSVSAGTPSLQGITCGIHPFRSVQKKRKKRKKSPE